MRKIISVFTKNTAINTIVINFFLSDNGRIFTPAGLQNCDVNTVFTGRFNLGQSLYSQLLQDWEECSCDIPGNTISKVQSKCKSVSTLYMAPLFRPLLRCNCSRCYYITYYLNDCASVFYPGYVPSYNIFLWYYLF